MQKFIILIILASFIATGCTPTNTPESVEDNNPAAAGSIADQQPDMDALKHWVKSLKGKSADDIKRIFSDNNPVEELWQHEDEGGKLLSYELPGYDIELYFSEGKVVLVSIDMTPNERE